MLQLDEEGTTAAAAAAAVMMKRSLPMSIAFDRPFVLAIVHAHDHEAAAEGSAAASQGTKRPREGEEAAAAEKRPRPASSETDAVAASSPGAAAAAAADGAAGGAEAASGPVARRQVSMVSSRTLPGMAHSSYLTFAMKITTTERCGTPHNCEIESRPFIPVTLNGSFG